MRKFVTTFNGARDFYSLPLAMHELDRLERHVTDFYMPDYLGMNDFIQMTGLSSRRCKGLPQGKTYMDLNATLLNSRLKLNSSKSLPADPYFSIDRSLSISAGRLAEETGSDLFLYSGYAYWAFKALPEARKYLFQFHPYATFVYETLRNDFEANPEIRWSFEHEGDSRPASEHHAERLEEWKLADKIVCASGYTKRSLVEAGCRPDIISVAPYGVGSARRAPHTIQDKSTTCRFLFVGQGVQRKGLHHLLRAWKLGRPDRSELIVVARRLDPGIAPLLDQPGVTYLPGLTDSGLWKLYSECDIFVMPSLVEGFGLVYGEALCCGLYCIGTENTGLPDLNLTENEAVVAPVGDVAALSAILHTAFERWVSGGIDRGAIRLSLRDKTWKNHRAALQNVVLEK